MKQKLPSPSHYGRDIHHDGCFGCGPKNSVGLQADFTYSETHNEVRFNYLFDKKFTGAPGFVHGGILSALLDETMGDLCFHLGYIVMTDEMAFKFLKATPVETQLLARAWFIKKEKRKIHLECSLTNLDESQIFVTGRGSFHILPPRFFAKKVDGGQNDSLNEIMEINKRTRSSKLQAEEQP